MLFADEGYDSVSMAEIARRVGIVEGAIYRHFPSKRDLLHQVIRSFYVPLINSATSGAAAIESPRERMRFLVRRHLQAMTEDTLLCRLVISEARSFDDYYQSEVADLNRQYTALFMTAFHEADEQGQIRSGVSAAVVRDLVYGSVEHLAWGVLTQGRTLDVDATCDQLMDVVGRGIDAPTDDPAGGEAGQEAFDDHLDRLDSAVSRLEILAREGEGERR